MKVELLIKCWFFEVPFYQCVDYTGRWKIKVVNKHPTLYIETFTVKGIDKPWWNVFGKDKVKAVVDWTKEDDLRVRVTEEYPIQQCGGMYE